MSVTGTNMASDANDGVAVAHTPPYTYVPNQGYAQDTPTTSTAIRDLMDEGTFENENAEEENDDSDILDEFDVDDRELSVANPLDYTKSYNRRRRQLDNTVPESQLPRTNAQKPKANIGTIIDEQIASLSKHAAKLKLGLSQADRDGKSERTSDRSNRATSEQVLDPRTRMILLQMINRNIISEVNGCVSTGKEANVYHAISSPEPADGSEPVALQRAVKIYKTSILVFKDRKKYVSGDFRFQQGYNKSSNQAMVKMWADKEMRNLKRLHNAGIPAPEAVYLRSHVLLMSFIGDNRGWSAPLLRDVEINEDGHQATWRTLFHTVIGYMRVMFQKCRLVHADLSEYNMLYHEHRIWIIDVSQSVEHDHPRSLEFLRNDIKNVSNFFERRGAKKIQAQEVFNFIIATQGSTDHDNMVRSLDKLSGAEETSTGADQDYAAVNEDVFHNQFIPQNLQQVYDIERDTERISKGEGHHLVYQDLLAKNPTSDDTDSNVSHDSASNASSNEWQTSTGDSHEPGSVAQRPKRKGLESKDSKKEHKHQVKVEKREKRKTKMPKHMKKSLISKTSRHQK